MKNMNQKYNQIMGYSSKHVAGQFSKQELDDRRKQNEALKQSLVKSMIEAINEDNSGK